MFPYRRNGPKKRGKGGPPNNRRHRDGGGGSRRVPGSAAELLPLLQPTTKALAQMLAGNTKTSGQLVHARNILTQATRMVDERHVDRLPPAAREEFFEQLARLKLTIADAEEAGLAGEPRAEVQVKPVEVVGADRLREVALRLAMSEPVTPAPLQAPAPVSDLSESVLADQRRAASAMATEPTSLAEGSGGSKLRLRSATSAPAPAEAAEDAAVATGARRERLRLKPARSAGEESEG